MKNVILAIVAVACLGALASVAEARGPFRRNTVVVNGGGANVVVRGGVFGPRVLVNGGGVAVQSFGHVRSFGSVRSFGGPVILSNGCHGCVAPARVLIVP